EVRRALPGRLKWRLRAWRAPLRSARGFGAISIPGNTSDSRRVAAAVSRPAVAEPGRLHAGIRSWVRDDHRLPRLRAGAADGASPSWRFQERSPALSLCSG